MNITLSIVFIEGTEQVGLEEKLEMTYYIVDHGL